MICEGWEETYLAYSKDPGRLKREILALPRPTLILIDEIQRIPALLNTVQSLLDRPDAGMRHRFLLTGSSARKLRRGGVNLLPGRVILEYLDPLICFEAGVLFALDVRSRWACCPGSSCRSRKAVLRKGRKLSGFSAPTRKSTFGRRYEPKRSPATSGAMPDSST